MSTHFLPRASIQGNRVPLYREGGLASAAPGQNTQPGLLWKGGKSSFMPLRPLPAAVSLQTLQYSESSESKENMVPFSQKRLLGLLSVPLTLPARGLQETLLENFAHLVMNPSCVIWVNYYLLESQFSHL